MHVFNFSNSELLALVNTIAVAISNELPKEDVLILATFFTVLGDSLALLTIK